MYAILLTKWARTIYIYQVNLFLWLAVKINMHRDVSSGNLGMKNICL